MSIGRYHIENTSHLFRFLYPIEVDIIRRHVMWKFLTCINGHNCDRAAKKVSAILSWENTKKANIEAQLKKIEVISFALFFALLIEGLIIFYRLLCALTKFKHRSYIFIVT